MSDDTEVDELYDSRDSEKDAIRLENGGDDNNSKDKNEEASKVKSNKGPTLNYGIVAAVLLVASIVPVAIFDKPFFITPLAIGLSILGMTYYSYKRKRDCSEEGIIFYSHSQIIYYWPIWLGAYVLSDLTVFGGFSNEIDGKLFALDHLTLMHLVIVGVVVFFTNVNLRGVWAMVFGVSALAGGLALTLLGWWNPLLEQLGNLELYVNSDFYRAMGAVLFIPWLFVVFVFDLRRYFHFQPSQITMVNEIGEGEKNFDSFGVVMEKHRDNYVQHMALGFGSGDLSMATHGGDREVMTFPNVLRINKVLKEVAKIREMRG